MNTALTSLDWSLIQTFLTVAETGSLSQAARRLGISQPTAGRQIKQVEDRLQLTLFHRRPRGFEPTETAQALLPHARRMAEGMQALSLTAAGRSDRLAGPVRITASQFTAHHHLPPILARIRREEPDISIDLVPSDASENLLYREADIAVRMYRTEQLDIITSHLGDLTLGIYGATSYLDRAGRPETFEQFFDHSLIGYDRSDLILRGLRDYGVEATRDWFATRCDNHGVCFELLRAGCGLGFAQCNVADTYPELERLYPDMPLPTLPLWLAAHEAVRDTPRIRRVWYMLAESLAPMVS